MKIFTIGFTKKNAEQFFARLKQPGLQRVVDTRLNNVSQLAGFTKKEDLRFFLREVGHIDYVHLPALAPTQSMLDAYKKNGGDWDTYEKQFLALMAERRIETSIDKNLLADIPPPLIQNLHIGRQSVHRARLTRSDGLP
jgi:hypothetical protein